MHARHLRTALIAAALVVGLGACSSTGGSGSASATGSAASGTAAAGADQSLAKVQKAGVITFGTEGTYKPFSFHAAGGGDLTGFDVEVARAIAGKLGVKAAFQETQWDAIFAGLDAGRFDAITNQVSITPERQAKYEFSTPYTVSTGVIVVKQDNTSITSFDSLKGKTTAQSLTSNWYKLAQSSGADVQSVEGWAQSVALVQQGRVDATINDKLTYLDYVKTNGQSGLKIAAETTDKSQSAVALKKGATALTQAIDTALKQLADDGTLTSISQKYFGADVTR
ncbi:amino acid ABC transporter substrate-binding protein [Cellulomonas sp. NTE-D12]|uniref:amino acid ABC transporter substrate-binding protein n=1 Tax=Cellulomonas sp. NTE-D12 TaxID=2962632 RepID=UPI0030813673|nr:amino acid ABC transporter substrate-binding protein [Cellulomonas sp. NTE-D12]